MNRALSMHAFLTVALVVAALPSAAAAQPRGAAVVPPRATVLPANVTYDPAIPTLARVLGYESGERITSPDDVVVYLKALHAAAPDRTRLIEYGRTWQRRPLVVLIVAAKERLDGVDALKRDLRRLADPRGLAPGDADALIARLPVVTWLMHAVHGDEISSSDAALMEAYHLLAARGDAGVDAILRDSVVIVDPLENPDGRARFLATNAQGEAATPDSEPLAIEHDQPWPGGRYNHYLFDMNRDWFAQSQPETRGRTALYLEWVPQVVVDLHEMGGDSTYYFAPPADPLNPHITAAQQKWFDVFGRANGAAFDARGFAYFIREVYDSFYPGYGESWPIFQGAIGMTYEQASARGLAHRRDDGSLLSYADGVLHHFTAAITTAETAARNRAAILRDYYEYRRTAVAEGETGAVREYLLLAGKDPSRADRLARLLAAQGIEVTRANAPFRLGTRQLPAGTWIVSAAQPAGRLVRNLLEKEILQPEAFVKEQDRRRTKKIGEQIYDVTAWSLPLVYDVEVLTADRPTQATGTSYAEYAAATGLSEHAAAGAPQRPAAPKVGFLLPWGSGTAGLVAEALQQDVRVRSADLPFTLGGRVYAAGTVLVRTSDNAATMPALITTLARRHGVELVPIDSAYVESGISLGSGSMATLRAPRVLMAWDQGTQPLSAGWTRYTLERRFGQPVTAVRVSSLARVDMTRYDVLVLPSGNYTAITGDALRRLKDWIAAGGTLITIGEASRWAARENVGLLATTTELKGGKPEGDAAAEAKPGDKKDAGGSTPGPIDFEKAIQPDRERPDGLPGALLRVSLDPEHWLSSGTDGEVQVMVEGARIFSPLKLDKGRNVGIYAKGDALVASGLVWADARAQYASKAYLMHQPQSAGHVIAFAEDPNYRAFTEATSLLFMNAVLLAPAH